MPKRTKDFERKNFEQIAHKHSHTLAGLIEIHKKGLITDNDYLYTLDDVKAIAVAAFKGGWNNSKHYAKPVKAWSNEMKHRDAKKIIAEAFTTAT